MAQTLRVLVFPVGKPGEVREIPLGIKPKQELVGGYVEYVPYKHQTDLVCNEEGKLKPLPPNRAAWEGRDTIYGQFFFVGAVDNDGDSTSLTHEQISKLKEEFDDETP